MPLAAELGSSTELPDADLVITAPGHRVRHLRRLRRAGDRRPRRGAGGRRCDHRGPGRAPSAPTTRRRPTTTRSSPASRAPTRASASSASPSPRALATRSRRSRSTAATGASPPRSTRIADGSYPISRSLYIYVSAASAEENPAVAEFVDFYLTATASVPSSRRPATCRCPTTGRRRPTRRGPLGPPEPRSRADVLAGPGDVPPRPAPRRPPTVPSVIRADPPGGPRGAVNLTLEDLKGDRARLRKEAIVEGALPGRRRAVDRRQRPDRRRPRRQGVELLLRGRRKTPVGRQLGAPERRVLDQGAARPAR